jgi:hypothetical protein
MGRRRQRDEGLAGALFDLIGAAVKFAWTSPPLHGFLMGVGLMVLLCGLVPLFFGQFGSTTAAGASVVKTLLGFLGKICSIAGAVGGAICWFGAVVNLFRSRESSNPAPQEPRRRASAPESISRASRSVNHLNAPKFEPRLAPEIPFVRKDLLTPTELKFFKILHEAFPDVLICPQVALAAIVDIPAYFNNNQYKYANRAPFAAKYADFTVVDPDTGEVFAIVELDDHTHDSPERQAEDAARDAMLDEVDIPVHRFDARKMPSVAELRALFAAD